MTTRILFDAQHLYYLPQFIPVYEALAARGASCGFVLHRQAQALDQLEQVLREAPWPARLVAPEELPALYAAERPDWIVFGNHCRFRGELPEGTRTALLYHGIGVKACYYEPRLAEMDLRFVEGPYRLRELQRRYPQARFADVGFPKLDPLLPAAPRPAGGRPVLLYAPTFYPSSIELMPEDWPEAFPDCDILLKPHFFSMTMPAYRRQRARLEALAARYDHVSLAGAADYSLLPYMARADLLISEASSALFEFAALDRPVVWLDFFKLRWTYRGPLRFRFNRRMDRTILQYADVAAHVDSPKALARVVRGELERPERLAEARARTTVELIGPVDGQASRRIAELLLDNRHAGTLGGDVTRS